MISQFPEFEPYIRLCAESTEPAWDSLSPLSLSLSLSLSVPLTLLNTLSLKKNKSFFKLIKHFPLSLPLMFLCILTIINWGKWNLKFMKSITQFRSATGRYYLRIDTELGAPRWLSWLSVRLRLRSWSHSPWVRAPRRALCWQLRAWSLFQILCLPLSLTLPHSCSVSLCLKNK